MRRRASRTMNRYSIIATIGLFAALLWLGAAATSHSQSDGGQTGYDEQELKNAGIATDGRSLLEYFHRRTPSADDRARLNKRAKELGSSVFTLRAKATDELIAAGRSALSVLRETARTADAETARRAQYCIGVIEQNTRISLAATAARVLVARSPPGAAEALLAYYPFADESWVEEEIRDSVKSIAYTDGKALAAFELALSDDAAKRRGLAAWIVGQAPDAKQRAKAVARLADDNSEVRLLAATALLSAREPAAAPTLIQLLTEPPDIAWRAEDWLFRLAGATGPDAWLDAADNNGAKVQTRWQTWWRDHQNKIDWQSLRLEDQALGLTMVAENQRPEGGGRLYETNRTGNIRWQFKIQNPIDVQWLPGGRVLVADSRASTICEMDTRGNVGWKHIGIAPTSVQRLPSGNTVVSTYQKILELTRDGTIVFSYTTQGHTYHARKAPNNHYVWIDACGEIGEVDGAGKVIAKTKVGNSLAWGSIERLRNGRYLVAIGGVGKVQEMDMSGKVYWHRNVANPNRAVRLANGHTLVCSHGDSCVYEFDANGNERWKHVCQGKPFAAQRR